MARGDGLRRRRRAETARRRRTERRRGRRAERRHGRRAKRRRERRAETTRRDGVGGVPRRRGRRAETAQTARGDGARGDGARRRRAEKIQDVDDVVARGELSGLAQEVGEREPLAVCIDHCQLLSSIEAGCGRELFRWRVPDAAHCSMQRIAQEVAGCDVEPIG